MNAHVNTNVITVPATTAQVNRLAKLGYPNFAGTKEEASALITRAEHDRAMQEPSAKSLTLLHETATLYGLAPRPLPHARQREVSSQIAMLIALGKFDKGFITAEQLAEEVRTRFCFRPAQQ